MQKEPTDSNLIKMQVFQEKAKEYRQDVQSLKRALRLQCEAAVKNAEPKTTPKITRNCDRGCLSEDPPCPFGCQITLCKNCQQTNNFSYPWDCMCPSQYGVMAEKANELNKSVMTATRNGYITTQDLVHEDIRESSCAKCSNYGHTPGECIKEASKESQEHHLDAEVIEEQSEAQSLEQGKASQKDKEAKNGRKMVEKSIKKWWKKQVEENFEKVKNL